MRKIFCFLLALLLTVGAFTPVAYAAEIPTVSISSGTVSPGGEVTLTVSIQDNPGVTAVFLYIYYDTSVFTVDPEEDLQACGGFRSSGGLIGNTTARAREIGGYDGDQDRDGVLAYWYNGMGLDTNGDGALVTVTLHASASAKAGSYEIGLGYSEKNVCNVAGNVALSTSPGTVTVTGNGTQPPVTQPGSEENQQPTGGESPEESAFTDIAGNWAEGYIRQAAAQGLIQGYGDGQYGPDNSMTRAELVTILWRANGSPSGPVASFTDLTADWYREAVAWAERSGIVNGVGDGLFEPDGHVTREQLVTILHRMAGTPMGMEVMLTGVYDQQYLDSGKVAQWAKQALYWTVFNEIYCGEASLTVGQTLAPQADANRAQIAVMIVRYLVKN